MTIARTIVDYSGRQVDMELLQTITSPVGTIPVVISNVTTTPKIVAGVQKMLQRYVTLLLTPTGDPKFAPDSGSDLLAYVNSGSISDGGVLMYAFALASRSVIRYMNTDDEATDTFGTTPDDERIDTADLTDYAVDYSTGTLKLTIQFTTVAGTVIDYVVPVAAAR